MLKSDQIFSNVVKADIVDGRESISSGSPKKMRAGGGVSGYGSSLARKITVERSDHNFQQEKIGIEKYKPSVEYT